MKIIFLAMFFASLTAVLGVISLSPQPGWPDSDGYAQAISQGRWVAHPPGYVLFMAAGHAFYPYTQNPYGAVLLVGFFLAVSSSAVLAVLLYKIGGWRVALWLGLAYSVSWVTVMLSTTGTPHSGDLFFVSLLLLVVWSNGFSQSSGYSLILFYLILIVIAAFRLSTLIMLGPAILVILVANWRNWILFAIFIVCLVLLKQTTLLLSGNPEEFKAVAQNLHAGAKFTSPVLSGIRLETILNIFRAGFWTLLGMGFIGLLCLGMIFKGPILWSEMPRNNRIPFLFTVLTALGSLAVCALYHIPHPGYISPAIPAIFSLSAFLTKDPKTIFGRLLPLGASLSAVLWISVWFSPLFDPNPSTKMAAATNAFLGQYTRNARLAGKWKSLSSWLVYSGHENVVPGQRRENLKLNRPFQ